MSSYNGAFGIDGTHNCSPLSSLQQGSPFALTPMSPNAPVTQSRQTSLKGLQLPITIERFLSLDNRQQNELVSEQVMGWQLYDWEEECSQFTPGAEWQNGSDYYALKCTLWAPIYLDAMLDTDEEALLTWEKGYGSRDWVTDIGAAMKLLDALTILQPTVSAAAPTDTVPWTWYCRLVINDETVCWQGATKFEKLPTAIVLAALEALGVIDNSPLAQTAAVEALVLQTAKQGPLAGVLGNNVHSRYDHQRQTWLLEETVVTQGGEETTCWVTQYRNGHYVFHAV